MRKIFMPKKINFSEIVEFFHNKDLGFILNFSDKGKLNVNEMTASDPFKPDLYDLYRLYQFVVLNKRTTILEFGSGWSSLVFSFALSELQDTYKKKVAELRRNNPFELFVLDNDKKYLNISKKRINFLNKKKIKVHYKFSQVHLTTFNDKICTEYENLPLCNPDFIYLDGPDQFNVKKKINGFTTKHKDLMPMSCDLLKIEYFLTPGTIVIVDGRGANAKFLKDNFKRNWIYKNDKIYDQHIFYLNDTSLGKYNDLQLQFYSK